MNPALDVSTSAAAVRPTHKLRCAAPRFDPGGGGINVARTITALGGEVLAIFPSGGAPGQRIETLLERQGVSFQALPIVGTTRESFTVVDRSSGEQYRFVLPGPALSDAERRACVGAVMKQTQAKWLVASGSLPPGVGDGFYAELAHFCRSNGVRMVLDTSGPALAACRGARLFLAKPSLSELAGLAGHAIEDEEAELAAARAVREAGLADNLIVSLGERGALLVTADGHVRMPAIAVVAQSAVGAGDAMLGAVVLALSRGKALADAVRYGVAAGAAAMLTPGTELVRADDVDRLCRLGTTDVAETVPNLAGRSG